MTPQLQQAIKLLQLSNMELTAFVEAELERNPLLEREEADDTGGAQGDASRRKRAYLATPSRRRTGTPETLPTRAKARRPAARTASGSTFRPMTAAAQRDDLDTEPQDAFPTATATPPAR